ncbi:S-methyl-5-thioribose-1-phosphate isomerase [Thioalbus denitrificans]|uniref:Methylthioribose-1-phosphate isomerase n=1 Tax=Thioalbus denitrificans TaxID=547122 RepID=A0A369C9U0_9GAMM|nr:S-methyl-5-thioribose-1-phosphate isomerase [Thioalbus denitrificans]RCX30659.1 translation initiation factor 2B subunit I family (IF-2BI) [Thioalbus denitrificans]
MPAAEKFQETIQAVRWTDGAVEMLDQRLLPHTEAYLHLATAAEVAAGIRDMAVRGAPAIGIAAAYGVVLAARARYAEDPAGWREAVAADLEVLAAARPTAVNLFWALERMGRCLAGLEGDPVPALLDEARRIHEEDIAANHRMGELGAALIEGPCGVLTHCNTGSLATGGFGTALGVIRQGFAEGRITEVFADETRPWLQGARLTAWELVHDHIPATLIADSAAALVMRSGKVGWVIVGSDRIAANGDVANKIGTYQLAVAARYHGVKFMVVAPTSTVDMAVPDGAAIPIETRAGEEVASLGGQRVAAPGVQAWNPVFDVTPAELVDAIVTERGVVRSPDRAGMAAMMGV